MRQIIYTLFIIMALGLTSCSKSEYTDAIPANSTALIAINAADFVGEKSPFASILMPFVSDDEKRMKGIDLTRDIYLFASGDGNLGICAPVSDDYGLDDFIKRLANLNVVKNHQEEDGKDFYTINDQWVIGYNDCALLIMGPVTGAEAETKLIKRMARQMDSDSERSIKNSTLWEHLQERQSHIRMVAQACALPEQIAAVVTLGAPKGTDPADVLLEAELSYNDGTLLLTGNTCSYNPSVRQALRKSQSIYRPITVDWQKVMGDTTLIGVFMNVEGETLTPHLQNNRTIGTMLMGTNAYDQIRTAKGDVAILLSHNEKADTTDGMFSAKVMNLPAGSNKNGDRLVVAVNMEALTSSMALSGIPLLGKVKRIIYNMNTKQ